MNLGECSDITMMLIDKYSYKGTVITDAAIVTDYRSRIPNYVNTAQIEVAKKKKLSAKHTITHMPLTPAYGSFKTVKFISGEPLNDMLCLKGLYYSFEVDNSNVTVAVYINNVFKYNVTIPEGITSFTRIYGAVDPEDDYNIGASDEVKFVFEALSSCNVRNRALWTNMVGDQYAPHIEYAMPTNFMELDEIIYNDIDGNRQVAAVDWESDKLIIPYTQKGVYEVCYFKYPTVITVNTPSNTNLENTLDAQECYPYYCAAQLMASEPDKGELCKFLMGEYELKLSRLETNTNGQSQILNESGW